MAHHIIIGIVVVVVVAIQHSAAAAGERVRSYRPAPQNTNGAATGRDRMRLSHGLRDRRSRWGGVLR